MKLRSSFREKVNPWNPWTQVLVGAFDQRRQFGSKSGGLCTERNYRKNWPFFANIHLLHPHSYKFFSLFLIKKTFSYVLSVQNTLMCFQRPVHDPPTTPSPKSVGRYPQPPRIDAYVFYVREVFSQDNAILLTLN